MKLYKTIPLESNKLTAEILGRLDVGEAVTVECDSLAERDSARQTAYYVRRNCPRPDGYTYEIKTSNIRNTVTVRLVKL